MSNIYLIIVLRLLILVSSVECRFRGKAGGYGLQGMGGCLIERIDGDYYTITGLPMYSLARQLNEIFSNSQ